MEDSLISKIFDHLAYSDNTIRDNVNSIASHDLFKLIKRISIDNEELKKENFKCICVSAQNDLESTIVILALIISKINFYLESSNPSSPSNFNAFCDGIIDMNRNSFMSLSQYRELSWTRNESCITMSELIEANSGLVFFSTSGTTGTRKSLCYKSEKLINNALKCVERFKMNKHTNLLVPVPVNHMYGLGVGLLPGILSNANICLIKNTNVIRLFDKILHFDANLTLLTPALCKMLIILNKKLIRKSLFITAGDKLSDENFVKFEEMYGTLLNLYGCTEIGAIATSIIQDRPDGKLYPLENVQINIDEINGELMCEHDAGFEFYISETGEPILSRTLGWHRTKDRATLLPDGTFKILGRIDNCFNRYGFLISVEDLECQIENLINDVNQVALVIAKNEKSNIEPEMIAICELEVNSKMTIEILRQICNQNIKKHLRPDRFYIVPKLPRLNNGKLNRHLLAQQYN
jgi:acyl-coenzyme A synthetase/AMP-(fatty) acid ligase